MAGNSAAGVARRLAARLRAEPLPVPMPPPARPGHGSARPAIRPPRVETAAVAPPPPSGPAPSRTEPAPQLEREIHQRSLASLPVIGSLVASLLIMGVIGWVRLYGAHGLSWATVQHAVQQMTAKPEVAEENLPYVTSMPLMPSLNAEATAQDQQSSDGAKQIASGSAPANSRWPSSKAKSTERR